MPEHVVQLVADGLNDDRKAMNGSRILLLGVAYKRDIDDVAREPGAFHHRPFAQQRLRRALSRSVCARQLNFEDAHTDSSGEPMSIVDLNDEEIQSSDCVLIVTNHSQIDYHRIIEMAPLIVDTRNALNGDLRRDSRAAIIRL